MKFFIEVEKDYWSDWKDIEIIVEFHCKYSFNSVILHVIAVDSKFAFNILIDSFQLIVDFKIINCE